MLDTRAKLSAGATRETLTWNAIKPVKIEAIEAQDADSPALVLITICPKGAQSLGALLAGGPTVLPGGQITWSGQVVLDTDEEVRAFYDYTTNADRLFLTLKVLPC